MNEKLYLKIQLDPSFLVNPEVEVLPPTLPCLDEIRQVFNSLKNGLSTICQNQDLRKASSGNEQDTRVEFTADDESEISRGDSYKLSAGMKEITIQKIREFLNSIGIETTQKQDLILQMLPQTRLGLHVNAFGALMLIPVCLGPSQMLFTPTSDDSNQAIEVTHNRFSQEIKLIFNLEISYGFNHELKVGKAVLSLKISSEQNITMEQFYVLIEPVEELRKQSKPEALKALESHLLLMKAKLFGFSPLGMSQLSDPKLHVPQAAGIGGLPTSHSLNDLMQSVASQQNGLLIERLFKNYELASDLILNNSTNHFAHVFSIYPNGSVKSAIEVLPRISSSPKKTTPSSSPRSPSTPSSLPTTPRTGPPKTSSEPAVHHPAP